MAKIICRICLRTDVKTRDIAETLLDFHDEITEYAIYQHSALKYCTVCEHLLLKFYNFSQKCRKANKILKTVKKDKNRMFPSNLHEQLPPTSLGFSDPSSMKLFNLNSDHLELMQIKEEPNDLNEINHLDFNLEDEDALGTDDYIQADDFDNSYVVKIVNVPHVVNDDILVAEHISPNLEDQPSTEKQECDKMDEMQEKLDDDLSDLHSSDLDDDSDAEILKGFEKNILSAKALIKERQDEKKKKLKGKKKDIKKRWERIKNLEDIEKIFEVQLFASEEEAKQEVETRKTSEPYLSAEHKCEICYTVFKYSKLLGYHMRRHSPSSGEHLCSICLMRFRSKRAANKHKYNAHYGKFQCKMCPMRTYRRNVMTNHYQQHTGVTYSCKFCDRTFHHTSTYQTHLRTRHASNHVCVTCARTFVSEKGLMVHRNNIHHTKSKEDSEATTHCEPCDLKFINEQVYNLHILHTDSHKNLAKNIIACKRCGASFENATDLKTHRHMQHPSPYRLPDRVWSNGKATDPCSICGATGNGSAWLYHHFRKVHPGSSYYVEMRHRLKYMCDTCGKCYTTPYLLRNHINTHTGTTPYACETCSATFSSRCKLQNHEERHHKLAKRECTHCGKKFVSASNLSNHMRFHIQDRRYKCLLCPKAFLHSSTLREHVRGVHHNIRRVRKIKRETQKT